MSRRCLHAHHRITSGYERSCIVVVKGLRGPRILLKINIWKLFLEIHDLLGGILVLEGDESCGKLENRQ